MTFDVSHLSLEQLQARKRAIDEQLREIKLRGENLERFIERERLVEENEFVIARLRVLKEEKKVENLRRHTAGIGLPFYKAVAARFPVEVVQELEREAMAILEASKKKG